MNKLKMIYFIPFVLPILWIRSRMIVRKTRKRKEISEELFFKSAKLMRIFLKYIKPKVVVLGQDNTPSEGGFCYVSNHQSYLDPILILANTKRAVSMVSKASIKKIPLFGINAESTTTLFIDRENKLEVGAVFKTGIKRVRKKAWGLGIYPEGHRSGSEQMLKWNIETIQMLVLTRSPIVPIRVTGAWKVFNKKYKPKRKDIITIEYLKPISYEDYKNMPIEDLADLLYKTIDGTKHKSTKE